ncbi:hypothetical protein CNMCM8694_008537 [Aspergillus lentulus]|nr:hypothetical protein CNMCM8060_007310 [Aspergillus lentulus]KAF4193657.1 hypothetical protein CNMCM8694_008537 [Aspergillus lentulus]
MLEDAPNGELDAATPRQSRRLHGQNGIATQILNDYGLTDYKFKIIGVYDHLRPPSLPSSFGSLLPKLNAPSTCLTFEFEINQGTSFRCVERRSHRHLNLLACVSSLSAVMSHLVLFSAFVLAVVLLTCWVVCVIRPELDRILDRMFPEYRPKTLREYFLAVKLVGGYGLHGGEEYQARKRMISKREYKLRGSSSAGLEVKDSISDPQWYYGRDVLSSCSQLYQIVLFVRMLEQHWICMMYQLIRALSTINTC